MVWATRTTEAEATLATLGPRAGIGLQLRRVEQPVDGRRRAADGRGYRHLVALLDRADAVALGADNGALRYDVVGLEAVLAGDLDRGRADRRDGAGLHLLGLVTAAGLGDDEGAV